jgi:hypothetical protein
MADSAVASRRRPPGLPSAKDGHKRFTVTLQKGTHSVGCGTDPSSKLGTSEGRLTSRATERGRCGLPPDGGRDHIEWSGDQPLR